MPVEAPGSDGYHGQQSQDYCECGGHGVEMEEYGRPGEIQNMLAYEKCDPVFSFLP